MENNAAVRLHFEDLAVFFVCAFIGEKSEIVQFTAFDQCEVFPLKYFED